MVGVGSNPDGVQLVFFISLLYPFPDVLVSVK